MEANALISISQALYVCRSRTLQSSADKFESICIFLFPVTQLNFFLSFIFFDAKKSTPLGLSSLRTNMENKGRGKGTGIPVRKIKPLNSCAKLSISVVAFVSQLKFVFL